MTENHSLVLYLAHLRVYQDWKENIFRIPFFIADNAHKGPKHIYNILIFLFVNFLKNLCLVVFSCYSFKIISFERKENVKNLLFFLLSDIYIVSKFPSVMEPRVQLFEGQARDAKKNKKNCQHSKTIDAEVRYL